MRNFYPRTRLGDNFSLPGLQQACLVKDPNGEEENLANTRPLYLEQGYGILPKNKGRGGKRGRGIRKT